MSDERKPRRSDEGFTTIPPELQPYMGRRQRAPVQRRGENPELDAAAQALRELNEAPEEDEPQQIDPTRGIGNTSAYVAAVVASAGAANANAAAPAAEKIAVAITDRPKELPAGNAAAATDVIDTRVFQGASGAKPTGAALPWRALRVAGVVAVGIVAVLFLLRMMTSGSTQQAPAEPAAPKSAVPAGSAPAPAAASAGSSSSSIEEGPAGSAVPTVTPSASSSSIEERPGASTVPTVSATAPAVISVPARPAPNPAKPPRSPARPVTTAAPIATDIAP